MATLQESQRLEDPLHEPPEAEGIGSAKETSGDRVNVGEVERAVSVVAGSILALLGLSRRSGPGAVVAGVGAAMIHRGVTGHCYAYQALGVDTAIPETTPAREMERIRRHGIHVSQSMQIGKSREELYRFWRNFENLPRFMTCLESVRVLDERRVHWVVQVPGIVGGRFEWDTEVIADQPNERIVCRSLPGGDLRASGEVRFERALGDRGTNVHMSMEYLPVGGRLGHWVAGLLGKSPDRQMREDLRNFKRLMECGEIPTIAGQPRGACAGLGRLVSSD